MALTDQRRAELEQIVGSKPLVLFMKGNRNFPQCGFSATVVGILNDLTPGYETVDILKDPSIREDMKEFSRWPTFPQLYANGEFVGGCDIIKEMHASGELRNLLGAKQKPREAPRLKISASAGKAFKDAAADCGNDVLRLEISPTFEHDLHFGPKEAGDFPVTSGDVVLHVEATSASRAEGLTIDYVMAPSGMAFKIDNPNQPPRVKPIGAKALKEMLDHKQVELFDVRPDDERAIASIAQAKKLDAEGQKFLSGLKKDAAIALHCHHGVRSRAAAERVLGEGFTNVYNLEGGIEAWSREVDASVKRY
jgi:monothiol glutaredoxin